jgi:hypothetical protein
MPDYSLVPVDYQPDFDDYSLVPVDYDPFAADGVAQQAQFQQPPTPTPPAQPQPQTQPQQPAIGAGQPGVNGPATGNSPSGSGGGAGVGNAGSDPGNPTSAQGTWAQAWSPESAAYDGFSNRTPPPPLTDDQVALIRQKIADGANAQIGSTAWTFGVAKGNFPAGTDKCNLFVHEMLTDAGASPGLPNGRWYWKHYPPGAAQWADPSYAIPGWRVLGPDESPQPGDVVAQAKDYANGATGHVTTVGPNNTFVGVGRPEYEQAPEKIESVPKKDIIVDPPAKGPLLYRRFIGR